MKITYRDVDYQKCVRNVGNSFDLILLASQRARELKSNNKLGPDQMLAALLEIQEGKLTKRDLVVNAPRKKTLGKYRKDK